MKHGNKKYHQGYFVPINKKKYIGDQNKYYLIYKKDKIYVM